MKPLGFSSEKEIFLGNSLFLSKKYEYLILLNEDELEFNKTTRSCCFDLMCKFWEIMTFTS